MGLGLLFGSVGCWFGSGGFCYWLYVGGFMLVLSFEFADFVDLIWRVLLLCFGFGMFVVFGCLWGCFVYYVFGSFV